MNGGIVTEEMQVYVHLYSFKIWTVGGSRTFRQGVLTTLFFLHRGPYSLGWSIPVFLKKHIATCDFQGRPDPMPATSPLNPPMFKIWRQTLIEILSILNQNSTPEVLIIDYIQVNQDLSTGIY